MSMRRRAPFILWLAMAGLACGQSDQQAEAAEEMSYARLASLLTEAGLAVEITDDRVEQPWSAVSGRLLTVSGESLQVFVHESVESARGAVDDISPDGSRIGTHVIDWIGSPTFYRADRVVVLYVGDNERIKDALRGILGQPLAGAPRR